MREKGLLDPIDIFLDLSFIKEVMEYPNNGKFKPSSIDPYDRTNDPIHNVQTFQSHMHYVGVLDAIICRTFLTTFCLAA